MSRASTIAMIGVVIVVAVYSQRLAIELLGPNSMLYGLVSGIESEALGINGEEWATALYTNVAVYCPWILAGAAVLGGIVREFRRDNVTAGQLGGPRR